MANIALGIHLFHGTWSLFQSMGWNNPRFNQWRRMLATGVATVVVVGNVSFPVMTLAGVIDHDPSVPSVHTLEESGHGDMHDEMHGDDMHDDMHDEGAGE